MWQMRIVEADRCWTSGDLAGAETILREVIAEGGPDGGPHATCLLGDLAGAHAARQQALANKDPFVVAMANTVDLPPLEDG